MRNRRYHEVYNKLGSLDFWFNEVGVFTDSPELNRQWLEFIIGMNRTASSVPIFIFMTFLTRITRTASMSMPAILANCKTAASTVCISIRSCLEVISFWTSNLVDILGLICNDVGKAGENKKCCHQAEAVCPVKIERGLVEILDQGDSGGKSSGQEIVALIPNLSMEKSLVGSKEGSKIIPDMLQMLFGYRHYVNRKCPTSFVNGLRIRIPRTIPVVFTFTGNAITTS